MKILFENFQLIKKFPLSLPNNNYLITNNQYMLVIFWSLIYYV